MRRPSRTRAAANTALLAPLHLGPRLFTLYCLLERPGHHFRVVADHVSEARRQQLRAQRGDERAFAYESYGFALDASGPNPVHGLVDKRRQAQPERPVVASAARLSDRSKDEPRL